MKDCYVQNKHCVLFSGICFLHKIWSDMTCEANYKMFFHNTDLIQLYNMEYVYLEM